MSESDTARCDRCGEVAEEMKRLRCDGHTWGRFCIECHDKIAEFALDTAEKSEQTPQEVWEAHNSSFNFEPPEKPGDSWSSDEYQELYDRVITRRTQWFCDKCSGRGPIGSLQKARRHVESQHGTDLVKRYETPREELEAATDGGTTKDHALKRSEENHGLGDFSGGDSE